jgi:hypothetical protein
MACVVFTATFRVNRNGCKRDRYPDPGGNKITPPAGKNPFLCFQTSTRRGQAFCLPDMDVDRPRSHGTHFANVIQRIY